MESSQNNLEYAYSGIFFTVGEQTTFNLISNSTHTIFQGCIKLKGGGGNTTMPAKQPKLMQDSTDLIYRSESNSWCKTSCQEDHCSSH